MKSPKWTESELAALSDMWGGAKKWRLELHCHKEWKEIERMRLRLGLPDSPLYAGPKPPAKPEPWTRPPAVYKNRNGAYLNTLEKYEAA